MATLTDRALATLIEPYLHNPDPSLVGQLSVYLDLLMKWNARTNLTAIREPEEIVQRHFGESLFAGRHLPAGCSTLLDFGSGAGFPGLPIQLLHPELEITLSESQNKKATFLREAVRTLGLATKVWAYRVEAMPATSSFDVVALRAVDNMPAALAAASPLATNRLMVLTTTSQFIPQIDGFSTNEPIAMPDGSDRQILSFRRTT